MSLYIERTNSLIAFHDILVLDLELCTRNERLVLRLDLKLTFVGRLLLLMQDPLMVCNYPWFGMVGTGLLQLTLSVLHCSAFVTKR